MKIVCFSQNKSFLDRYKECLHVKSEKELDTLDSFILLLDLEAIKHEEDYFFEYIKLLPTCRGTIALAKKPTFDEGKKLLTLGVKGYDDIQISKTKMKDALLTVKKGNIWLYTEFLQMMIDSYSKNLQKVEDEELDILSKREKEIAQLTKTGLSNKEIANNLDITERTVKAHLSSIYEKLNIKDRIALVIKLN